MYNIFKYDNIILEIQLPIYLWFLLLKNSKYLRFMSGDIIYKFMIIIYIKVLRYKIYRLKLTNILFFLLYTNSTFMNAYNTIHLEVLETIT